ncbi:MAG: TonB-dependent receptor [Gemmatimonadales bacterium]
MIGTARLRFGLAVLGAVLLAGPTGAQVPDTVRTDTTAVGDTTDYSALFLKAYEEGRERVPVFPRLGSPRLLPSLVRAVFDQDSLEWHNAETVSDILAKVPGVYLWRGGWIGRPEPVGYQGRGAAGTEYVIDGMPLTPLGRDSLSFDPSLLPLTFFERIEVERIPGLLRIHLFTRRHEHLPERTRVGVASGDFDIARYIASLEKRTRSGFGFVAAAEHLAVPLRTGDEGGYSNTQGWLQLSWVPAQKPWRAMAQYFTAGPTRGTVHAVDEAGTILPDTLLLGINGGRSDFQANLVYQPNPSGIGPEFGLQVARSAWREDSTEFSLGTPDGHARWVDQSLWLLSGRAAWRTARTSLGGEVRYRSRWTPLEVKVTGAATPPGPLTLAGEAVSQRHDGSRSSRWILGRAGLEAGAFRVAGQARVGSWVGSPMDASDQAESRQDLGLLVGFERPRLAVEAGYWRTDGFTPRSFPLFRGIDSLGTLGSTRWLTVSARVAPLQWFVLDGWYSNPVGTRPVGQPPTHGIVNATIQSRFLPTFRSGIFGLKLQGTMESWGTGALGLDDAGAPIELKGATFFRAQIQLKIGSFIAYYDRANFQASRLGYVPGISLLRLASTFGVRWEFSN